MDLSVLFLGTAGSVPTVQRAPASLLVRRGGDRLLIDCGEGTQRQLLRSVGLPDVEHVFLTHYHADHLLGLPGMLKTFALRGREVPLTVYGPRGPARPDERPAAGLRASSATRCGCASSSPSDAVELDGYADRRLRGRAPRSRRSATRSSRTSGPGASTPALAERAGRRRRARLRAPAARRGGRGRRARASSRGT